VDEEMKWKMMALMHFGKYKFVYYVITQKKLIILLTFSMKNFRVLRRGTQYSGNPAHDVVSMRVRLDQMEQTDVKFNYKNYHSLVPIFVPKLHILTNILIV
jgi:hypothetical protein